LKPDKSRIIAEIKRTATENNGLPLGWKSFENSTGISTGSWRGKYWRNWGDAIEEAGFPRNQANKAHDNNFLLLSLAQLCQKNKRFPTYADLRLERESNKSFPGHHAFNRLGSKEVRVIALKDFIKGRSEFLDVLKFLDDSENQASGQQYDDTAERLTDGFVYMIKFDKHYKIGKTFAVPRRHREISLELPEKPDIVHAIRTDDPAGIEAYWHNRFASKRSNGEWFSLTREDIQAFKRRKTM
jgi:hypothetical protein